MHADAASTRDLAPSAPPSRRRPGPERDAVAGLGAGARAAPAAHLGPAGHGQEPHGDGGDPRRRAGGRAGRRARCGSCSAPSPTPRSTTCCCRSYELPRPCCPRCTVAGIARLRSYLARADAAVPAAIDVELNAGQPSRSRAICASAWRRPTETLIVGGHARARSTTCSTAGRAVRRRPSCST